jgi:hypothetical protein
MKCRIFLPFFHGFSLHKVFVFLISKCSELVMTTRPRGRPRYRWQDEVREDGRIVGVEEWQEKYVTERNGRSS